MKNGASSRVKRSGIIFILSAPSGAGKTTLGDGLRARFPEIRMSVSCTTRSRRAGEVDGRHYHFISDEVFDGMRRRGEFAEWAEVHGYRYGTPQAPIQRSLAHGRDVLLDIDVQGARKIKQTFPDAVSIFVLPPSWRELERRLRLRGTDSRATIQRRLANARDEMRGVIEYDYYIVNRVVGEAVGALECIVKAERVKTRRVSQWGRLTGRKSNEQRTSGQ